MVSIRRILFGPQPPQAILTPMLPEPQSTKSWFWIACLWLAFAIVNATQIVGGMRAVGMKHPWSRLFVTILLSWIVWALATPVILRLGRRFPLNRWRSLPTWLIHLGVCVAV